MKVNDKLENLFLAFGICGMDEEINSLNTYLGKLYELKSELEDAVIQCENEISKNEKEKRP